MALRHPIVSFLQMFCDDYDSPWSEDEAVLGALITYALDLLLPPERWKPLVEREIEFGKLASELIDTLMINTTAVTPKSPRSRSGSYIAFHTHSSRGTRCSRTSLTSGPRGTQ